MLQLATLTQVSGSPTFVLVVHETPLYIVQNESDWRKSANSQQKMINMSRPLLQRIGCARGDYLFLGVTRADDTKTTCWSCFAASATFFTPCIGNVDVLFAYQQSQPLRFQQKGVPESQLLLLTSTKMQRQQIRHLSRLVRLT